MANKHHRAIVSWCIFVMVASFHTISHVCVEGRQVFNESNLRPKPKGTVKSIEVPEDGDMIDCVLFHKQPAFDHLLIKSLQADLELTNDDEYFEMYQNWHKYGECPKGTVPIRRTRNDDIHRKQLSNEFIHIREYATIIEGVGVYQGTFALINIWNPKVEANEYSSAQVWVQTDSADNVLEARWIVHPARYHDSQTRLFIHWSNDDLVKGCFDLDCPGFVQTSRKIALGVPLKPTSVYNRSITESSFHIYKSKQTGNWYFKFQRVMLGYWPSSIVTRLHDHAETLVWGGEIINSKRHQRHTTTQMGSGHFSNEGNRRSAYMRTLQVINKDYVFEPASNLPLQVFDRKCYDVIVGKKGTNYKSHFYFGGPGYSSHCP